MVNEKTVGFRIEPYVQEATLQIILDILIMVIISTILTLARFTLIVSVAVVTGYFVIALVLHYMVIIQAMIDKWKKDYITETVSIDKFVDEYSFAGDRLGRSNIRFFYPSEMQVCKYRIKVISNHGEKKQLRSVMSFRRLLKFAVLDKCHIEYLQVTYMKKSKILIHVDATEEINKITSVSKKETSRKSTVNNAINSINMLI